MLTAELCFIEIINQIMNSIRSGGFDKDDKGELVLTSTISFCKCRNVRNIYVFEGYVNIDTDTHLHYYFSNKRSCVSLSKQAFNDSETTRLQNVLIFLVNKLFGSYHIDQFVTGLVVSDANCV